MKITLPYLRKAALWSLSIIAAAAAMFAVMWGLMEAILWIAGAPGPLYWVLIAAAGFVFLVLVYVGMDLATEIITKRKGLPMTDSPEDRVATLEAEVAKLRAEMDLLLAERDGLIKGLKKLLETWRSPDLPTVAARGAWRQRRRKVCPGVRFESGSSLSEHWGWGDS